MGNKDADTGEICGNHKELVMDKNISYLLCDVHNSLNYIMLPQISKMLKNREKRSIKRIWHSDRTNKKYRRCP